MRRLFFLLILSWLFSDIAVADALDSWPTWSVAQPYVSKQVPPGAMIMRGKGTDAYYVLEVDPATGAIPVDVLSGTITFTVDYSGIPTDPAPSHAAYVGGVDGNGDLQGIKVDTGGELQVDVLTVPLPTGVTLGQKTMANSFPVVLPSNQSAIPVTVPLGQQVMASSTPVVIASNQTDLPVVISAASTISVENLPTTVAVNVGAADASTLRVSEGSRVYADSATNAYGSVNVTTGAWVQVIAVTAAAMNQVCITDQSGQIMELGAGAALSETRIFLIARGFSGCIPLRIAASTRLSLKAVSATANSGDFVISGMN